MRKVLVASALIGSMSFAAGHVANPTPPKSPRATDALQMDSAAIRRAVVVYWQTCESADLHLKNILNTAADEAHKRNDGVEEQACLDAAQDIGERINYEQNARGGSFPPAALKPLRFESRTK